MLAIGAHPDDIEFGCGATLAKWADAGAEVTLCVLHRRLQGHAGTPTPIPRRCSPYAKRSSGRPRPVLGAHDVEFLGYVDGELDHDLGDARGDVRRRSGGRDPTSCSAHDPWAIGTASIPTTDMPGLLAIEGIVAARDPHFFPEQGLAPHRPQSAVAVRIRSRAITSSASTAGSTARSRRCSRHRSQWRSTMGIDDRPEEQQAAFVREIHDSAQAAGLRAGVRAGEAFRRIDDL